LLIHADVAANTRDSPTESSVSSKDPERPSSEWHNPRELNQAKTITRSL
jgi:hypothetical protein